MKKENLIYRHECFAVKYTIRKIHTKPHPGLEWHMKIVLKSVGVSSKHLWVFPECLQQSLVIFGNLRKMFGNIHVTFGQVLENL